ncbi:hypothetical protein [Thalassotalea sp. PS06]|uniref:hypothetical protein n=1 Tax=Thalassotalea sp. PS06 TaxID=2594005 RepID=UPI001164D2E9|nr:hypothetical protein [Thalassotalea sp. PS06]QDP01181.1 hypothetical protein FNC98_07405 [Thalassotalea sp. PS06]
MRTIKSLAVVILAALAGGLAVYVFVYTTKDEPQVLDIRVEQILEHANVAISANNCEGESLETVGDVMASILEINQSSRINRTGLSCDEIHCWYSISECNPWQSNECGSRLLRFEVNQDKTIVASSFQCLEIP